MTNKKAHAVDRQRKRKHSTFTAERLVAFIQAASDRGIDWVELRRVLAARAEHERRLEQAPQSGAALARQGLLVGAARVSDYELGRLSMLLEMMDAETKDPERLLSDGIYRKSRGFNVATARVFDRDEIMAEARKLRYFDPGQSRSALKLLRMDIAKKLRLNIGRDEESADRGIRRAIAAAVP